MKFGVRARVTLHTSSSGFDLRRFFSKCNSVVASLAEIEASVAAGQIYMLRSKPLGLVFTFPLSNDTLVIGDGLYTSS